MSGKHAILVLCVARFALPGFAEEPAVSWPETLRAVRVHEDTFDYVLTAYTAAGDGQWTLSINHRAGQTYFAQTGGMVGAWRVVAFEPTEERVFVPSVNAYRTSKSGRATLEDAEGRQRVLVMGRPLETPGWRVTLASLVSGALWNVREGDRVRETEAELTVVRIAPDEPVAASFNEQPVTIPLAESEDTARLATVWQEQAEARERQERWAQYQRYREAEDARASDWAVARPVPTPRVPASAARRPEWFFGTEYRYPSQYEVWMLRQGPDGAWRPFVVPRAFESGRARFGWGSSGYGAHSYAAPDAYGSPADSRSREMVPPYAAPMVPHPESRRR